MKMDEREIRLIRACIKHQMQQLETITHLQHLPLPEAYEELKAIDENLLEELYS